MYEPMVFSRKFAIWALYGFTYAQVKYSLLKIRGRIDPKISCRIRRVFESMTSCQITFNHPV